MSFSRILHKAWRRFRAGAKPARSSPASAPKPGTLTPGVPVIETMWLEGTALKALIMPALPSVSLRLQLSTVRGRVLHALELDWRENRILPGRVLDVTLGLGTVAISAAPELYILDASQADRHAEMTLSIGAREGRVEMVYPTVESFLRTTAHVDVPVERLLPGGAEERAALASMSDEDFIQHCYYWLLGRCPDQGGLKHHKKMLAAGGSRQEMIVGMYMSEESTHFRRLALVAVSGQPGYPFSPQHVALRRAMTG